MATYYYVDTPTGSTFSRMKSILKQPYTRAIRITTKTPLPDEIFMKTFMKALERELEKYPDSTWFEYWIGPKIERIALHHFPDDGEKGKKGKGRRSG